MEKAEESDLFKKTKEFLETIKKGEEVTKNLLKENKQLNLKVAKLEERIKALQGGNAGGVLGVQEELERLQDENITLKKHCTEMEAENHDFASRYVEMEEENNSLANLYVASYQLHTTLNFEEVVRTIIEIVINMIGSDQFAIFIFDDATKALQVVVSEGVDVKKLKKAKPEDGVIGDVIRKGEGHFESDLSRPMDPHEAHPIICVPLKIKDKIIGALAIFSLLEQKRKGLARVDYEILAMLAGHTATALFSSKLYSQSERKLSTIQGFLDLLMGKEKQAT
jgi:transcriptional regulator with GAF, ATPase, and Fis domain